MKRTAQRNIQPPRGFALPAAIFGLVIVGVLVTGGFYIARQESRIGVANREATRAFYLAERGVGEVVESWNASNWSSATNGTTRTFTDTLEDGVWTVEATRLSQWTYFLDGRGDITRGGELLSGASRRLGMMVKLSTAEIDPPAALTTRGVVRIAGGAEVSGFDVNPDNWDMCAPATNDKTGVLTDPAGGVIESGKGYVSGDPPEDTDPAIADSTFTKFGDLEWQDLIDLATWHFNGNQNFSSVEPTLTGTGTCDFGDNTNWGDPIDPTAPCGSYFPIIYVDGNARLQGNPAIGQGMLLVEGNADIRGTFIYHGIIISQGTFQTQGSGHRILGGVLASNIDLDSQQEYVGQSVVQYSDCAITRALLENPNLTRVRPLAERSWVDLSNLSGGG
jgi:hypothetical protein